MKNKFYKYFFFFLSLLFFFACDSGNKEVVKTSEKEIVELVKIKPEVKNNKKKTELVKKNEPLTKTDLNNLVSEFNNNLDYLSKTYSATNIENLLDAKIDDKHGAFWWVCKLDTLPLDYSKYDLYITVLTNLKKQCRVSAEKLLINSKLAYYAKKCNENDYAIKLLKQKPTTNLNASFAKIYGQEALEDATISAENIYWNNQISLGSVYFCCGEYKEAERIRKELINHKNDNIAASGYHSLINQISYYKGDEKIAYELYDAAQNRFKNKPEMLKMIQSKEKIANYLELNKKNKVYKRYNYSKEKRKKMSKIVTDYYRSLRK